jgi:hypothetical protein
MECLALGTHPEPFIEREGVKHMPTAVTPLRGWIPLVNLDKGSPIPCGFVLQLAGEFTPSHIANTRSQGVVLDHVLDGQTLDADHLVLVNNTGREFLLIIPPSISNLGMDLSNFEPGFVPVVTVNSACD